MSDRKCQTCGSDRVASTSSKSVDLNSVVLLGREHDGYVPTDMGIGDDGYGDYLDFSWCLNCGQIQGKWPRAKCKLEKPEPKPKAKK